MDESSLICNLTRIKVHVNPGLAKSGFEQFSDPRSIRPLLNVLTLCYNICWFNNVGTFSTQAVRRSLINISCWMNVRVLVVLNDVKVIPLKKKEYLKLSKTWSSSRLCYEHYKNAIKNGGHRARFCATWMAIMVNR